MMREVFKFMGVLTFGATLGCSGASGGESGGSRDGCSSSAVGPLDTEVLYEALTDFPRRKRASLRIGGDRLFWTEILTEEGEFLGTYRLLSAPQDGSEVPTVVLETDDFRIYEPVVDAATVFVRQGSKLFKVNLDKGSSEEVLEEINLCHDPIRGGEIVQDDRSLYLPVTCGDDGNVLKVDKETLEVEPLAPGFPNIMMPVVAGPFLYFANASDDSFGEFEILELNTPTKQVRSLGMAPMNITSEAAFSGDSLFITNANETFSEMSLWKVPTTGDSGYVIQRSDRCMSGMFGLQSWGDRLFFADGRDIYSTAADGSKTTEYVTDRPSFYAVTVGRDALFLLDLDSTILRVPLPEGQ